MLYRAKFSLSIIEARQLIYHNHVLVNGYYVTKSSYCLSSNDKISIRKTIKSYELVKQSLKKSNFWPIPPKHIVINYKTLNILFLYNYSQNKVPQFNIYLDTNSFISSFKTVNL